MSHAELPLRCDVLVVGAGPAGAACAQWLARAGVDVVLVDPHDFPRDKICGDGLIPDAHHALERLGVHAEVMAAARQLPALACIGPHGGRVEVPGRVAMLPRLVLDDIVCRAAVRAGARLHTPWRFERPLVEDELVVGALLRQGDVAREVRARWVVLATGALPQPLLAADMCTRRAASGIGLRAYVKNDAMVDRIRTLEVVWDKRTAPGYGWIFPAPGGRFNIGVGIGNTSAGNDATTARMKDVNLRQVFDSFCEFHEPARELMRTGTLEGGIKGAPLRFSLAGARHARTGLLVTGEAAGSTYAFTGEGIGKALETGILAAEALLGEPGGGGASGIPPGDSPAVPARYAASLAALKPRFDLYERANQINAHPWLADLVIWRARRSPRLLRKMSGVLEETSNPGNLISARGLWKVFFPGA